MNKDGLLCMRHPKPVEMDEWETYEIHKKTREKINKRTGVSCPRCHQCYEITNEKHD